MSTLIEKHKRKILITSLLLLVTFNMPNINWVKEKYLQKNKIWENTKYKYYTQQLFEQLWYDDYAHTLRVYDDNDIDLHHSLWSEITMQNLLNQFARIQSEEDNIISIPGTRTSYKWFKKHIHRVKLGIICNTKNLEEIQVAFNLDQKEVICVLSLLMNLALCEFVESQQEDDRSVRLTTKSWHSSLDHKGNITWIINALLYENDISISDIQSILWNLQKYYNTKDTWSTLQALSNQFWLLLSIEDNDT